MASLERIEEPHWQDWLEIGTIVAAQGLGGEVRIYPNSDFPERFTKPGKRWLQLPNSSHLQAIALRQGRYLPGKNLYVVGLAGVCDRAGAEALRNGKLWVAKQDRPQLEAEEYHVSELIGLAVYHQQTGKNLGVVVDIYWAGNDLLAVKLHATALSSQDPQSLSQVYIPFVKEIVPVVDLAAKRLEILPPPGLLELNQPQ
ncbi:MAG: ribosome maturation factor RimM [Chloroflexaceae bacterium]|nr:ribosome maturation factor RimM [Chloroflexaceae bacterium]